MKKIPICFCTDDGYVLPTVVAITSLIKNKRTETIYDIYVLVQNVSSENIKKIKECANKTDTITILNAPERHLQKNRNNSLHLTVATLLRFELCDMLPQYDKLIYLDGDICVQGDLSELYRTNLNDEYVAAVCDFAGEKQYLNKKLGIQHYFNAGVLLYNAKKFRQEKMCQKCYEIWKTHSYFPCMDQDVQNLLFLENVKWLDPKWNVMFNNLMESQIDINAINSIPGTNYKSLESLETKALILHLTNSKKPWKDSRAYGFKLWKKYLKMSPFKHLSIKMKRSFISLFYLEQKKNNKKITYLLGIPILKTKYYVWGKKKYFCGVLIKKKKNLSMEIKSPISNADLLSLHQAAFLPYKNSMTGKDVVLLATGPSLKDFQPLKDVVYIGVNKAFKLNAIKLDYLFVQDYVANGEVILSQMEQYAKKMEQSYFMGILWGWLIFQKNVL